jgi:hypothetical protein
MHLRKDIPLLEHACADTLLALLKQLATRAEVSLS